MNCSIFLHFTDSPTPSDTKLCNPCNFNIGRWGVTLGQAPQWGYEHKDFWLILMRPHYYIPYNNSGIGPRIFANLLNLCEVNLRPLK